VDLYTLTENYLPNAVVDEFSSVVWTERYSAAGDVQLVVPAYPEYIDMLREGTFLGLAGTKEVMELKTQSIENSLMTVIGTSLLGYLDERMHWVKTDDVSQPIGDLNVPSAKLGELLADRVDKMVINPVSFNTNLAPWNKLNIDWAADKLPGLELGAIDHSGTAQRWTVPVGPLYSVLSRLALDDGLGLTLYLDVADPTLGFVLKFATYRGVDRTSGQSAVPLIRLSPELESLSGLKEVRSIEGYKNVVYVNYQDEISIHYEDPANPPVGRQRRVMVLDAKGEPIGQPRTGYSYYNGGSYTYLAVGDAEVTAFRAQNAKDALANHNYIRAIDGEVSRQTDYLFGRDYGLGDILELEGLTGVISKARVTEFIRAQDNKGERAYPTLSVVK